MKQLLQGDQIDIFGDLEPVPQKLGRVANDFYPTPAPITQALIRVIGTDLGQVFEPCAGHGAITNVLQPYLIFDVLESDLTWGGTQPRDARTQQFWNYWADGQVDNVITNPPFNCAAEILEHAWQHCSMGCAFLLRLSFLEPTKDRAEMLKEMADHMRYVIPVSPRPKFRADTSGCDSVTCAWFVWEKEWSWERMGIRSPFQFVSGWRK